VKNCFFVGVDFELLCKLCPNWRDMFDVDSGTRGDCVALKHAIELKQKEDGAFELVEYTL
jgi:hypothetical protein